MELHLSLATLEEQTPAFLFGKTKLAWLYLRQNCREECRLVMAELEEMDAVNDELNAIWNDLQK